MKVACTVLAVMGIVSGIAMAVAPTHVISGVVQTGGGAGVEGVDVVADNGGASTVTAADGSYFVTVSNHWDGTVTVSKTGWLITPASNTYTNVSADVPAQNYTAYQPKISGVVTKQDGTPLAGATVSANSGGSNSITDASGYYELYVPYNWSGSVSASLSGYYFEQINFVSVTTDQIDQHFSGFQPTLSGSTSVSGATVTVSGVGSVVSTPSYSVVVPYGWSGTVSAELADYGFTNSPLTYNNVVTDQTNQNFTPYQPTISGSTSVAGATVTVNGIGTVTSTPNYSVVVPYGWSGTVSAELADYGFTNSPLTYNNVVTDQISQNFMPYQPTISGYVRRAEGMPLSGVTVTADNDGGTAVTNTSGFYEIVVPYGWLGSITALMYNLNLSPASYSYSNLTDNQSDQNFDISSGGVITVKADGTGDVPTIQTAIDFAVDGDIVQVEDGIYTGDRNRDIDFRGKVITVRGNVADPNMVVIDCQGTEAEPHRGFVFTSDEGNNSVLEGVTVKNGYGSYRGGGIYINNSSPTIRKCIITNCHALYGGGICCYGTNNPAIEDCMLTGNSSSYGGGLNSCNGTILNCIVSDNSADSNGGGLWDCDGPITNCTISGNSASINGGGLWGCDRTITDCTISGNSVSTDGGGFYGCYGIISNCTVSGNYANRNGGGFMGCYGAISNCTISGNSASYGGGIYNCDVSVTNCTVSGNSAEQRGGGFSYCDGTITNCIVNGNSAEQFGGGFYYCDGTIMNCTVSGNYAPSGGGFGYGFGTIRSCIVNGNSASECGGGFLFCDGTISNCTVIDNFASWGSGFYDCDGIIESCIMWGNTPTYYNQILYSSVPSYSCIQNWADGGVGNISDDPMFIDADSGDYHLSFDSPCINAGDSNYIADSNEVDIDGDPRVVGRLDMGADEAYVTDSAALSIKQKDLEFVSNGVSDSIIPHKLELFNYGAYDSDWTIVNDCQWLTVTPLSGVTESGDSSGITISIDPNHISYGVQSCQFEIVDPLAVNSPQVVSVSLEVLRPELTISQNTFSFSVGGIAGPALSDTLTIENTGYDTLNWSIVESCDWLSVSAATGQTVNGTPEDVVISVDPAVAGVGFHTCDLIVSDANADNSPQVVTVTFEVWQPVIRLGFGIAAGDGIEVSITGFDSLIIVFSYHSLTVPYGWSGTITPVKDGVVFSPNVMSFENVVQKNTSSEFTAIAVYSGGDGSEENPFRISDANDLRLLADYSGDWDKCFVLTNDIDMGDPSVVNITKPIGYDHANVVPFSGQFDGRGFVITNLHSVLSLFGYVSPPLHKSGPDPEIRNLTIINPTITAEHSMEWYNARTGGLIGRLISGIVENCTVIGGDIKGNIAGGLIGRNYGATIVNCHAIDMTVYGDDTAGGLVGVHCGVIENCSASGNVVGEYFSGGLVGVSTNYGYTAEPIIKHCWSSCEVKTLEDSFINNTGYSFAGGLAGQNDYAKIINCYSTGAVTGISNVGGFVGHNRGEIINSYSIGTVSGLNDVGGFCGYQSDGEWQISNSFWDFATSGIGLAGDDNYGAIGKTTVKMKRQYMYTVNGWDFVGEDTNGTEDVWRMCVEDLHYPKLAWQYSRRGDFVCPDGVGLDDLAKLSEDWLIITGSLADANFDGKVDTADMAVLSANWGSEFAYFDIVYDGIINLTDVAEIGSRWKDGTADMDDLLQLAQWWLSETY